MMINCKRANNMTYNSHKKRKKNTQQNEHQKGNENILIMKRLDEISNDIMLINKRLMEIYSYLGINIAPTNNYSCAYTS